MLVALEEDVAARARSSESLAHSTALLESLIASIPDLVFFKDLNGVYFGCNPAFTEFVGRARDAIIGHTDYDFFPREVAKFFRDRDRAMIESGHALKNEEWIDYPDGRRVLVETYKAPIRGEGIGNVGLLGFSRDITARKHAEEELRKLNDELEKRVLERTEELKRSNESLINEMIKRIALEREFVEAIESEQLRLGRDLHDGICQELCGIQYGIAIAAGGLPPDSPERQYLDKVAGDARRTTTHTRLLSHGLAPMVLEASEPTDALWDLASNTEALFGVRCRFERGPGSPLRNASVTTNLYRIAQEAIQNAIRHGKATEIVIRIASVSIDLAVLSIKDNGCGLLPLPEGKSQGMGMRTMRYRARTIGGELSIGSVAEGGTLVECTIPLHHDNPR